MDPDDLRQAFIEDAQSIEIEGPAGVDLADLAERITRQARGVSASYRETGDAERRHALEALYRKLDACLRDLNRIRKMPDGPERKHETKALDTTAGELLERVEREVAKGISQKERIEKGRKQMLEKERAGAGANTFKRMRAEIEYLIANYVPANDARIETLIDQWRTSGDPQYSPEVRIKYLNVRKKRDSFNYPI